MIFARWVTGLLAAWCWSVWGSRSGCDIKSLKDADTHLINLEQGWASTAYKNGRNKLSGKKRNTRSWNAFFICTCPKGKHVPVDLNWAWTLTPDGNPRTPPTFCTECPLNCLQLKQIRAGDEVFRLFSKWSKTPQNWSCNHGDVVGLANKWFHAQGAGGEKDYDSNSGRKALAGWLSELNTPYPEGFEIHGDLYDVWSQNYQPTLPYSDFSRRVQSPDARIATTALRRFA